jgi:hypothetical protein
MPTVVALISVKVIHSRTRKRSGFTLFTHHTLISGKENNQKNQRRARPALKYALDARIIRQIAALRIADGGIPADSAARSRHQTRNAVNGRMSCRKGREECGGPGGRQRALRSWNQKSTAGVAFGAKAIRDVKEQVMVLALAAAERAIALERP